MKNTIRLAFIDTIPIMAGYTVLGAGFGILMASNGFSFLHSLLMSVFIYAGSLQYLGISLLTGGVDIISIALSSFLVNARHLLYGISRQTLLSILLGTIIYMILIQHIF